MATETGPAGATFSSPSMRARVHLLAGLAAVDELERAWARRDYWAAREYVRSAQKQLAAARTDFEESWSQTNTLEIVEPALVHPEAGIDGLGWIEPSNDAAETETEARMAWGDR